MFAHEDYVTDDVSVHKIKKHYFHMPALEVAPLSRGLSAFLASEDMLHLFPHILLVTSKWPRTRFSPDSRQEEPDPISWWQSVKAMLQESMQDMTCVASVLVQGLLEKNS